MNITNGLVGVLVAVCLVGVFYLLNLWFNFCFNISNGEGWGLVLFIFLPVAIFFFLIGALN